MGDPLNGAGREPIPAPRYHGPIGRDVNRTVWKMAALLFGSGFAALVYETVWIRQFRLVFGASTAATAAVLAVYLGGLGIGSIYLGRFVDRHPNPLRLYSLLEAIVTVTAAVSPLLIAGIRTLYLATGGSSTLGAAGSTVVRLLLGAIVLLPPTIAMGGTLPAVVRAVTDEQRRAVALLYGANTIGGCAGVIVATFVTIERFGHRNTLWLGALVNACVAAIAWIISSRYRSSETPIDSKAAPARMEWVLPAVSGVAGFVFLLMEIVWYRELIPLVGLSEIGSRESRCSCILRRQSDSERGWRTWRA